MPLNPNQPTNQPEGRVAQPERRWDCRRGTTTRQTDRERSIPNIMLSGADTWHRPWNVCADCGHSVCCTVLAFCVVLLVLCSLWCWILQNDILRHLYWFYSSNIHCHFTKRVLLRDIYINFYKAASLEPSHFLGCKAFRPSSPPLFPAAFSQNEG